MLNGTLTLHDIRDVEAFCATIIQRSRIDLTSIEHDDLLAYLITEAWRISGLDQNLQPIHPRPAGAYDRGDPQHPPRFSVIATERLRHRITDWLRQTRADHRYPSARRYALVALDDQLADTLTASPLDDPQHRSPDLQRLLRERPSQDERPYPSMDTRPTRRAA